MTKRCIDGKDDYVNDAQPDHLTPMIDGFTKKQILVYENPH